MTTLSAMLTEIETDLDRSTTTDDTLIRNKIAAAIRHYQPMRFFFNETRSSTFSTVAGTDTYTFNTPTTTGTIGAEFYRIDKALITVSSISYVLKRNDYAEIEQTADNYFGQSRPTDYAYVSRSLRLWPNPDNAYTIRLLGHQRIAAPATDNEANNPWMMEAYDLIMARTKAELFAGPYEQPGLAQVQQEIEREALSALRAAGTTRTGTGSLVPTQF